MQPIPTSLRVDAVAGVLAMLFGVSVLLLGWAYPVGSATSMGPGFMPRVLGVLSILLGLLLVLRRTSERLEAGDMEFRSMLFVLAGVVIFAALINTAGLPLATIASVLVSSSARRGADVRVTALLAVVVAAACTGLFVFALGLPMRLVPWN